VNFILGSEKFDSTIVRAASFRHLEIRVPPIAANPSQAEASHTSDVIAKRGLSRDDLPPRGMSNIQKRHAGPQTGLLATSGQELAEVIEIARGLRTPYDRHTGKGRYPPHYRSSD
jgi:hypothetical protein